MHATTNATLVWGLLWVSQATTVSFVLAGLILAPYHFGPAIKRAFHRLPAYRRHTHD